MPYNDLIAHIVSVAWIVMMAVWIISAFTAKRYVRGKTGRRGWLLYRLAVIAFLIIVLRSTGTSIRFISYYIPNDAVRSIGAILVVLGVALAIWARYHLGRNWGMPLSEREGAELVTSGPYASIRNPIYAGVLLAFIGSALSLGMLWALMLVLYGWYFFYSVFGEEKIMLRLFPDTYPAYKARTKRLIPGVW